MHKIVLLRHGESVWNMENRFTGWTDVDLTEKGSLEAINAGKMLQEKGFKFDIAFSSVLKRANKTLNIVLEQLDQLWLPVEHSWRLNERHYGALQGLNKADTTEKYGEQQVLTWRRSYDTPPPAMDEKEALKLHTDRRYQDIPRVYFPKTECLKDTVARVVPYWETVIVPQIMKQKNILIVAHGNSLRALIKYLDKISDQDIISLNIPTAQPLIYELDADLKPIRHFYLADQQTIQQAQLAVANQGKK